MTEKRIIKKKIRKENILTIMTTYYNRCSGINKWEDLIKILKKHELNKTMMIIVDASKDEIQITEYDSYVG